MRNAFKRSSIQWDEQAQNAESEHTVLRFPKNPAAIPAALPLRRTAQEQYLIQKAMLDENIRNLGETFTDTAKHGQKHTFQPFGEAAKQASSLKSEGVHAIMHSAAFLTLGPAAFKMKY